MQQIFAAQGMGTSIEGFNMSAEMCANSRGTFSGSVNYNVTARAPLRGLSQDMVMNLVLSMSTQGRYAASAGTLAFWDTVIPAFRGTVTVHIGGRGRTKNMPPVTAPHAASIAYTCHGNILEIQLPIAPNPRVRMNKVH